MPENLCITVRFAYPTFHGRGDSGEPEWPPSPLRLFQSLVAAAAARFGNAERFRDYAVAAFEWLAGLHSPTVVAAPGTVGTPFRIAVPNNDMDLVAGAWAKRVAPKKQPAELKTLKPVRPMHIGGGGEFPAVHYVWQVAEADRPGCDRYKELLFAAAHDLVALGWGTDLAIGHGRMVGPEEVSALKGERWEPTGESAAVQLRVPTPATFDALVARYAEFRDRLGEEGFRPVPPLTAFAVVGYRRPTDTAGRPFAAFELRTIDFERFRPFDATRNACSVAGMVRNALAGLARQMRPFGWTDGDINACVHGHTPDGEHPARGPDADRRFAYLPLPSIERRGSAGAVVTAIRRVLVVGPPDHDRQVAWARVLSGQELTPLGNTPPAALRLIDKSPAALRSDANLGPYVATAAVWSTVTPVVMPGHDDPGKLRQRLEKMRDPQAKKRLLLRIERRAETLLRKAFEQAGLPAELVRAATLEWRSTGFRPGVDLAHRYRVPESPKKLPTCHVRVKFPVPICGPLAVGAGRYRGMGVFVAEG
jgi:CRISPR-associated protein Csb2